MIPMADEARYERSLAALRESLSEELQQELATLRLPLDEAASQSEIRIAQAQLVGWLEGTASISETSGSTGGRILNAESS
jgi:hypothetical protein